MTLRAPARSRGLLIAFVLLCGCLHAQQADQDSIQRLKLKRTKFHLASAGVYAGTFLVLNDLWYKGHPRSAFHFIDDGQGWLQIDKAGHAVGGYYISAGVLYPSYRSLGYSQTMASFLSMGVSFTYMATIELLDGFSEEWGASWPDIAANTAGIALAGSQSLLWDEQRAFLKFSSWTVEYPNDPALLARAEELYGTGFLEQRMKDYNGMTLWLSVNPGAFLSEDAKYPKWLSWAVGYGATGMYGAMGNTWRIEDQVFDYRHIPRERQWYLSPDIDFTRLPINWKPWKHIAPLLNVFKFPAPALELRSGELYFHPLFF